MRSFLCPSLAQDPPALPHAADHPEPDCDEVRERRSVPKPVSVFLRRVAENFPDFSPLLLRKAPVSSDRPDCPQEIEKPLRNKDTLLPGLSPPQPSRRPSKPSLSAVLTHFSSVLSEICKAAECPLITKAFEKQATSAALTAKTESAYDESASTPSIRRELRLYLRPERKTSVFNREFLIIREK